MAWAYKAGSGANNGNAGSGASVAVTLGAAVSIGDRIIVAISVWQATTNPSISSVTDDKGNAYALDKSTGVFTQDAGFPQTVVCYSAPVTVAGTPVITVAGTFEGLGVSVVAYSGLDATASPADVSVAANGNSSTPSSGATSNTTSANELVIGIYGDDGFNQVAPSTHYGTTRVYRQSNADGDVWIGEGDSGASGSAITTSLTTGNGVATPWGMLTVVYKLAGAAAASPFNGSADPNPAGRLRPNVGSADPLKLNLRSQDKQFGAAGQFKAYDWPNPKGRPFPSDLRNFFDPSEVWLFGTDKQFAGPGQFKSYDYPNPIGPRRSIDLLTWTSNGLTSRLPAGAVASPFFQSEFPNPRGPRAASDNRGFVGFYVIDDNAPFVPVAFDNPRGRQRSIDLLTAATSNALATLLGVAVAAPFAQTDYPNPRGPRAASDLRTWLQGAITAAQPVPFVPVEFANPRTAGRAVDLRSWLISLQGSTLAPIAAVPFSQSEWPNPRGRAHPVDLRGFINAMEQQLIGKDKMFGAAGEVPAYDWQNPIWLKRLPLSYVQNWLTYAPDQIYFRRTQFYRLGGRGAGRR